MKISIVNYNFITDLVLAGTRISIHQGIAKFFGHDDKIEECKIHVEDGFQFIIFNENKYYLNHGVRTGIDTISHSEFDNQVREITFSIVHYKKVAYGYNNFQIVKFNDDNQFIHFIFHHFNAPAPDLIEMLISENA